MDRLDKLIAKLEQQLTEAKANTDRIAEQGLRMDQPENKTLHDAAKRIEREIEKTLLRVYEGRKL